MVSSFYKHIFAVFRVLLAAVFLVPASCSKAPVGEPEENILVRIGDKTISVKEFIKRAEYTVRPSYCRSSNNLDKKIVLNSLIAEKLMAIEAGDTNRFIQHDRIQAYLRGRREQSMRQWLYEMEARNKVVLDTSRVLKTLKVAGRKYKLSYFFLQDKDFLTQLKSDIETTDKTFEGVYSQYTGQDTLPQREVEWAKQEHDLVLDSLFSEPLTKNQIVGPIEIAENQYMLAKVNGWIDRPAISDKQIKDRWRTVTEEFTDRESARLYNDFIFGVMEGKKIDFNPDVFYQAANLLGPLYFKSRSENKEMMGNAFLQTNTDTEKYENTRVKMEVMYQETFFAVGDEVWTVKDFMDELAAHPLVFREKKISKNEFGEQLKFAIIDMVRDTYLNEVAYERGYDKINVIERSVSMWQDNLNYQFFKSDYLKSVFPDSIPEMPYTQLFDSYLNPLVDSLQTSYSDIIEVDTDAFNKIKLTRVDMSVSQENVPFSKIVPSFPIITNDNALDYGKKISPAE